MISQVAEAVFGHGSFLFVILAAATALVLFLAANTAYNGFPLLGSILAQDRYLPRQLHTRGDRLAFSNGIVLLAGAAVLLVWIYGADSTRLIQLYIVGVFVSFTLSQTGMVRHWNRLLGAEKDPAARRRMVRARPSTPSAPSSPAWCWSSCCSPSSPTAPGSRCSACASSTRP